jgi:hypothetical protein
MKTNQKNALAQHRPLASAAVAVKHRESPRKPAAGSPCGSYGDLYKALRKKPQLRSSSWRISYANLKNEIK